MKLIPLTQGLFTQVDDEDYEKFSKYKWCAHKSQKGFRPLRGVWQTDGKVKLVYLYREIMGAKKGQLVDHINGDTLDNRKSNLRVCTNAQNLRNRGKFSNKKSSPYKGVSRTKSGKWSAFIQRKRLGVFDTVEKAVEAYNAEAKELFGEFANLVVLQSKGK